MLYRWVKNVGCLACMVLSTTIIMTQMLTPPQAYHESASQQPSPTPMQTTITDQSVPPVKLPLTEDASPLLPVDSPAARLRAEQSTLLISKIEDNIKDLGEKLAEHQQAFEVIDQKLDPLLQRIAQKRGRLGVRLEKSPSGINDLALVDQKIAHLDELKDALKGGLESVSVQIQSMQEEISKAKQTQHDMLMQPDEKQAEQDLTTIKQHVQASIDQQTAYVKTFAEKWTTMSLELTTLMGELDGTLATMDQAVAEQPAETKQSQTTSSQVEPQTQTQPAPQDQAPTINQKPTTSFVKQMILDAVGNIIDLVTLAVQSMYDGIKMLYDRTLAPIIGRFVSDVKQRAAKPSGAKGP